MNTQTQETKRKALKGIKTGKVVSDKRDKTRKVEVGYLTRVPKYGKYIKRKSVFHVHDEANTSKLGDIIEIVPCRPMSKTKSWRFVRIVEASPVVTGEEKSDA